MAIRVVPRQPQEAEPLSEQLPQGLPPAGSHSLFGVFVVFGTFYFGAGILIPYFPFWLTDQGLDPPTLALALALPAIARIGLAPLFGWAGDNIGHRLMIRVMCAAAIALCLVLIADPGPRAMVALTALLYTCWQSMPLQIDGIAVGMVRRKALTNYGQARATGSMGFIAANFLAGSLLAYMGSDSIPVAFVISAVGVLLATSLISPHFAPLDDPVGRPAAPLRNVWLQPRIVSVMVAAAMVHGAHSAFVSFGGLYMKSIGYSETLIATAFAAATSAEVAMFFFGHRLIRLLPPIAWIAIGAATATVRWIATGFVTSPAQLIALQLTHALTFSGTYLGMIGFLVASVEDRQSASAQGIYIAMFGIFNAALTLVVGQVFSSWGGLSFMLSSILAVLSLFILGVRQLILRRIDPRP